MVLSGPLTCGCVCVCGYDCLVISDLTVMCVCGTLSGQYNNDMVHCLRLADVGTFSHQLGPVLLLHIAKDQERYFGTNLMPTMMRMILYMNLVVCILILE